MKPDGTQCARIPSVDSEYCWQHQPQARFQVSKWLKRLTIWGLITVLLATIGFYSDLISLGFRLPYLTSSTNVVDTLEISRIRRIDDVPITLSPTWALTSNGTVSTGIVPHFWQLFISNNGDSQMSVIDYKLARVEDEESPIIDYSGMNQGMFWLNKDNELVQVEFPINIESGESLEVFVKAGVMIHPLSYRLIKDINFGEREISLLEVNDTLRAKRLDLFGNQLEEIAEGAGYTYPELSEIKDETFRVSFITARGFSDSKLLSQYGLGGLYDEALSR